jgi:selenocysteine-specific elongation factor
MLVGTAGHIDHGKTTLLKALTGVDADRLPEEKARGITLNLGYAYAPLADGSTLGFVDVPGHEKLIHNMLAGATGIDFVLLVVAADDGPMPQTREHLELLDLLGLTHGAVALTKIDAVSPQRLADTRREAAALVAGTAFAGCPLFAVSGRTGVGVDALRAHLDAASAGLPPRRADGRFRLAVDRRFTLPGIGTVVTGTAHAGTVRVGDAVRVSPSGPKARVRSLHVHDRPAESGRAGERCAIALAGDFGKNDIERGMWIVDPALDLPLSRFHGELRVPPDRKPLRHLQAVHVHLGTEDIPGRVALLDCQDVPAGGRALVELLLDREILALHGDRFILRDAGAQHAVAGGRVLDVFPPARFKRTPQRLALLDAMRDDDPAVALERLLEQAPTGVALDRFAVNRNLAPAAAETLWRRVGLRTIRDGGTLLGFTAATWAELGAKLLDALAREHAHAPDMVGVERERLRRMSAAGLSRAAFDALGAELLAAGRMAQTRAWLHLPSHRPRVSAADRAGYAALKPLLDAAPYNPPRVRDVANATGMPEEAVRQLFKRIARLGELYPVAHDHYYTAAAVADLAAVVRALNAESGGARIATLRDRIFGDGGGGRKAATQILEFFDRTGYTRRVRDDHVLRAEDAMPAWTAS